MPQLAIVSEELWQNVHERLSRIAEKRPEYHRRPKRLFSGLIVCGSCGGQITIVNRDRYGCANARQKGVCDNKRTMSAPGIEFRILEGLQEKLLKPEHVDLFLDEYHAEIQRLQKDRHRRARRVSRERTDLERQIARLVDAIAEGSAANVGAVGKKLQELEARLAALNSTPAAPPVVEWHPGAVDLYKRKISELQKALNADGIARDEATAAMRGLVDTIVASPGERRGQFTLSLHGHLVSAINMAKYGSAGGGWSLLRTRLCVRFPVWP